MKMRPLYQTLEISYMNHFFLSSPFYYNAFQCNKVCSTSYSEQRNDVLNIYNALSYYVVLSGAFMLHKHE